jgi:pimeloyl-ACP methyl ester carboxylesterase
MVQSSGDEKRNSTSTRHPHVGAPNPLHSLFEPRALLEMALLPAAWPLLLQAPAGDGHPVLLLPGFLADERSLIALEVLLKAKGYAVETWGLGRNVGFHRKYVTALEQKIRDMHFKSGRKISLVGWSLGGVFCIVGAYLAPECVRSIVTLGSPVSTTAGKSSASPLVKALYRMVAHPLGSSAHATQSHTSELHKGRPPPVPISCLYALGDGVVPPQEATIEGDPALHENIRVTGSHVGLGFNGVVLAIVADRLAQPENDWKHFAPTRLLKRAYELATYFKDSA